MHTMTPRQRELATQAHNMIYSYLRLRKLPIDDYYRTEKAERIHKEQLKRLGIEEEEDGN